MVLLKTTSDGSHTLYVPEIDEHFHSINGAVRESMIVFIGNGYQFCKCDPVNILEVGFGTGLNAFLTLITSLKDGRRVNYTSLEKNPLPREILNRLNYPDFAGPDGKSLFDLMHSAVWDSPELIAGKFTLEKRRTDFISCEIEGNYNLIYFDAFGPDKQPEMWEERLFKKLAAATTAGGIFVTYSSKGIIKRFLRDCGFEVALVPGPPGKREMIRAVKK
jgi:tRNA U34 5-methylaminomethyl-2-thiouridine-forming methyltransferase MnmC